MYIANGSGFGIGMTMVLQRNVLTLVRIYTRLSHVSSPWSQQWSQHTWHMSYLDASLAHYDVLIDQSACRIVCVFLGSLVHGDACIPDALRAQLY